MSHWIKNTILWLMLSFVGVVTQAQPAMHVDTLGKVIAGTSLVEDVVLDLTNGRVETLTLVSGSSCPGHSDMKVSDVFFAAQAQLAIFPAFQKHVPSVQNLLQSANNMKLQTVYIPINDNWMIPSAQREVTKQISELLVQSFPEIKEQIIANTHTRLKAIDAIELEVQEQLASIQGLPVVAAKMQADFLNWAGLNVITTFPGAEEMMPNKVVQLIEQSKKAGVVAVIENLQSGTTGGSPIASELKVKHFVISNFPGSSADDMDYFSLLRSNVRTILNQLSAKNEAL